MKFTAQGGIWIKVGVELEAHGMIELRFAVRDTGIGIPPEKLDVIFEAFRAGRWIHDAPGDILAALAWGSRSAPAWLK